MEVDFTDKNDIFNAFDPKRTKLLSKEQKMFIIQQLLTKTPEGIQIDDIMKGYTTTTSIRNLIDKLIINDGFMILIINKPVYTDNMSRENYKVILDEHIQLIKDSSKYEQYTDLKEKIEKLFNLRGI